MDLTFLLTHRLYFDDIVEAYTRFDKKMDGMIKIVLKTDAGLEREKGIRLGPVKGLEELIQKTKLEE